MRDWVCSLQLLMTLASAVILRSDSCGTHDYILPSQIRDSRNLEGHVPLFIFPRNRVPFLMPPTTRGAMVEVFDPASTREMTLKSQSQSYVTTDCRVGQSVLE
jgi:hypothetical protein